MYVRAFVKWAGATSATASLLAGCGGSGGDGALFGDRALSYLKTGDGRACGQHSVTDAVASLILDEAAHTEAVQYLAGGYDDREVVMFLANTAATVDSASALSVDPEVPTITCQAQFLVGGGRAEDRRSITYRLNLQSNPEDVLITLEDAEHAAWAVAGEMRRYRENVLDRPQLRAADAAIDPLCQEIERSMQDWSVEELQARLRRLDDVIEQFGQGTRGGRCRNDLFEHYVRRREAADAAEAEERRRVLEREQARRHEGPPVIVPGPPPPAQSESRVQYQGPPVIVPGPPPPPPAAGFRRSAGPIRNPDWALRPSAVDLERFFPPRALEMGISGRATIRCTVQANGVLTGCSVVSEAPPGYGFGQATIRASTRFRLRPQTRDGAPVGGAQVDIPLSWEAPEPLPEPPLEP